ncbi:MAG: HYR domain-containing protein, partial [Bacteroidia bacterium]|nr:HYR domain-containing protein [Bacteroidia bacterium]
YTQTFTNITAGAQAGYLISLIDNVIDAVALNGFVPSNWEWAGSIFGDNIIRNSVCDNNIDKDWSMATPCNSGSYGVLNPGLPLFHDNGTISSLQSEAPSIAICSFDVNVIDNEAPMCAVHDTLNFISTDIPITILGGACIQSVINVPNDVVVNDINLSNIVINHPDAGALTISLLSPEGTEVFLANNLCGGTSDVNIGFDDQADLSLAGISCNPMGNGNVYQPISPLKELYLESAQGEWTLSITSNDNNSGTLESWSLQILETTAYAQSNVELNNDLGFCGANYTWTHPVFEDNCCDGNITLEYITDGSIGSPMGGAVVGGTSNTEYFEVGVTTLLYTLTDQYGNQSTCGFDVTVIDAEFPEIDPQYCLNQIANLQPGQCDISIAYDPLVSDNCSIASVVYDPPLKNLPIGINEITLSVTDETGNVTSCTFTIEVREYPDPSTSLACNDVINLSLGSDCAAQVTPDMLLEGGPYGCYDNYCIEITDQFGNPHPSDFDITDVGQQFNVTIIDCLGAGNSCSGIINVEEKLIPEIACPQDTLIFCNQSLSPDSLGYATLESCEEEYDLSYWDDFTDFGPCANPRAQVVRTWTIIDETGNSVNCEQLISIRAFDLDAVEYPVDLTFDNPLECSDVNNDPTLTDPKNTGYPMLNGQPIYTSSKGLCMYSWNWDDQILYSCGNSYEILRTWIIRDMCLPVEHQINPVEYVQVIKVIDSEPPLVHECEQDILLSTDPWNCGAETVIILPEIINDNCSDYQFNFRILGGGIIEIDSLEDGTVQYTAVHLGVGNHRVDLRVKDDCGNFTDCGYNITVEDNTPPIAITTQNIVVNLTSSGEEEDS